MSDDYPRFSADVLDESTMPAPIEIGHVEIGDDEHEDADGFLSGHYEIGNTEIGNVEIGNTEIGAVAIRKVLAKARDNRQPAPPMNAVDVDAPERDDDNEWDLMETCIGAAEATGNPDPFPLLAKFMQRAGAGLPARIVRVDTQESYDAFRAASSPEMAEFRAALDALSRKLAAHERDPHAHERFAEEIDDLTTLGAQADRAMAEKRIDFQLPPDFDRKHDEWLEGDEIFASIAVPAAHGGVWWLTSAEPHSKSVHEASRHAADANVPASAIIGALPAIGERLGAATAIKEMAAAVPAILRRPEARGRAPFLVRIEPKDCPALSGLSDLASACRSGDAQACDEWNRLAATAPTQVKQAMGEAVELLKKAA